MYLSVDFFSGVYNLNARLIYPLFCKSGPGLTIYSFRKSYKATKHLYVVVPKKCCPIDDEGTVLVRYITVQVRYFSEIIKERIKAADIFFKVREVILVTNHTVY